MKTDPAVDHTQAFFQLSPISKSLLLAQMIYEAKFCDFG